MAPDLLPVYRRLRVKTQNVLGSVHRRGQVDTDKVTVCCSGFQREGHHAVSVIFIRTHVAISDQTAGIGDLVRPTHIQRIQ